MVSNWQQIRTASNNIIFDLGKKNVSKKRVKKQFKQKKYNNIGDFETGDRLQQEFGQPRYNWLDRKLDGSSKSDVPEIKFNKTTHVNEFEKFPILHNPKSQHLATVSRVNQSEMVSDEHMITVSVNSTQQYALEPVTMPTTSHHVGQEYYDMTNNHHRNAYNSESIPQPAPNNLAAETMVHSILNIKHSKQLVNGDGLSVEPSMNAVPSNLKKCNYNMMAGHKAVSTYGPISSTDQPGSHYSMTAFNEVLATVDGATVSEVRQSNSKANTILNSQALVNGNSKNCSTRQDTKPKVLKVHPQRQPNIENDGEYRLTKYDDATKFYSQCQQMTDICHPNYQFISPTNGYCYDNYSVPTAGQSLETPSPIRNNYSTFNINEHVHNYEPTYNVNQMYMHSPVGSRGMMGRHITPTHPAMHNQYDNTNHGQYNIGYEDPLSDIIVDELKSQSLRRDHNNKMLCGLEKHGYCVPGKMSTLETDVAPTHSQYNKPDHRAHTHDTINTVSEVYSKRFDYAEPVMERSLHPNMIERYPMNHHLHSTMSIPMQLVHKNMRPTDQPHGQSYLEHPMRKYSDSMKSVHPRPIREPALSRPPPYHPYYSNSHAWDTRHGPEFAKTQPGLRPYFEYSMHQTHFPHRDSAYEHPGLHTPGTS